MSSIIQIEGLEKTYASGVVALSPTHLEVQKGEIFALLGPNGAGKTTMINIVCGIVTPSAGRVLIQGHDITREYRKTRSLIGLVPQELSTDAFETVWDTVRFSRGLFGKAFDAAYLEQLLRDLALWEKRDAKIMTLSGGMKRRVLIAKALSHEPDILFLDEPTAGVDVELRKGMWNMVHKLRERGVTIILTTHYIEEAEQMADRIGVIRGGKLIVVEEKRTLMKKLGKKQLTIALSEPMPSLPEPLCDLQLELSASGDALVYTYDSQQEQTGIAVLLRRLAELQIEFKDLNTRESSLEDIFVGLIHDDAGESSVPNPLRQAPGAHSEIQP